MNVLGKYTRPAFAAMFALAVVLPVISLLMPAIQADQSSAGSGTISSDYGLSSTTAISLVLFMGALALALYRRDKLVRLQKETLRKQALDIDLNLRAMNTHTVVSVTDPAGFITEVNGKFAEVFGYDKTEVVGKNTAVLYGDNEVDPVFQEVYQSTQKGVVWNGEQKLRTKSGKLVITQTTVVPLHDENGRHIKNVSMRTDVTEARLAEADTYLTALLRRLHDEVFIYSVDDQKILFMNDRALKRCGWTMEESKRRNISDTHPQFDVAEFRKHVRGILVGEEEVASLQVQFEHGYAEINTR